MNFQNDMSHFYQKEDVQEILYIKDAKENKTAEIHINDNRLFYSLCRSFSCFRIQFAMATSRVVKLHMESKVIDPR